MKQQYYSVILLTVVLIFFEDSFSQTKLGVPFEFSFNIPVKMSTYQFDNRPPYQLDKHSTSNSFMHEIALLNQEHLKSYVRSKDTVDIVYYIVDYAPWLPSNEYVIHFEIDTSLKLLRNVSLSFHYHYVASVGENERKYSLSFSTLNFTNLSDSTIIAKDSGAQCRTNLLAVSFSDWQYNSYGQAYYSNYSTNYISLLEDTSSYKYRFTLSPPIVAADVLKSSNDLFSTFKVSTSLPDHTINFNLPSSTHPETLFIYDILGREAAHIEIAAGMTQYSINSSRFPSGHYFARLGNSTSHFVIE